MLLNLVYYIYEDLYYPLVSTNSIKKPYKE